MVVDWTISLGSILQIGSMIVGGLIVLVTLRNMVSELQKHVTSVRIELSKMGDTLTKMAVAETRLDNTDTPPAHVESDIHDLRRGVGSVKGTSRQTVSTSTSALPHRRPRSACHRAGSRNFGIEPQARFHPWSGR
jgi:hypothetical protein